MQAAAAPCREPRLIHYAVEPSDLDRHLFTVECRISDAPAGQVFRMASWIPGSYLLREFARHVVGVEAVADGRPTAIEKVDKSAWRVAVGAVELTVRLTVHAYDLSVRGACLDRHRGFFNGTSLFVLPEGRDAEPVELDIGAPVDPAAAGWRVATTLPAVGVDDRGFGRYRAENYAALIDHPAEMSAHVRVAFEAGGVPHALVVAGTFDADLDRVSIDLRQLCEAQIDFFGRPAPFDSYLFLGFAAGQGFGGLEHSSSSSLIFSRNDLPRIGETSMPRSYQRFLALCSHEYFHSWHVKRSKPAAFDPYRLDRRNHTRLLWVFEGITSYYQERFLLTSGLIGTEAHLRRVAESLTRVYRVPGRFRQTLAESSFDAWDSLYKAGPASVNTGVSYYSKGALVALALDLHLRIETDGRVSLDDVVKALWLRFGATGTGLPEDGFERLAGEVAGVALDDFFAAAIRSTEDVDLEPLFAGVGLQFVLRPATGPGDTGGPAGVIETAPRLTLGATASERQTGIALDTVLDSGPAGEAGLGPGDLVVAIDGFVVTEKDLDARLARYGPGARVRVDYIRDGLLLETVLELAEAPADTCEIRLEPDPAEKASRLRTDWLGA